MAELYGTFDSEAGVRALPGVPIPASPGKRRRFLVAGVGAAFLVLVACATFGALQPSADRAGVQALGKRGSPTAGSAAGDPRKLGWLADHMSRAIDNSTDPCDDFYAYACGGWIKSAELPPARPQFQMNDDMIRERVIEVLKEIVTENLPIITPLYKSCMDEAKIEALGAVPLRPWLEEIWGADDKRELLYVIGRLQTVGVQALWSFDVQFDSKNPEYYIAMLEQGGLVIEDARIYDGKDELSKAYLEHVTRMLAIVHPEMSPEAVAALAKRVYDFENAIDDCWTSPRNFDDPSAWYHYVDISGLQAMTPGICWDCFFRGAGARGRVTELVLDMPRFFRAMDDLIAITDLVTLKHYTSWLLINSAAPLLSSAFVNEHFDFYGRRLSGQKEMRPRADRCVQLVDAELGQLMGHYFVYREFPEEAKRAALRVEESVKRAFLKRLDGVEWMDEATRQKARAKLGLMHGRIGYPERWPKFEGLLGSIQPTGDLLLVNAFRARQFQLQLKVEKIGRLGDRQLWSMSAETVNAYYAPEQNTLFVPAAQMLPPDFDPGYPTSVNYGYLGALMGHEILHGFDDEGSHYDEYGTLTRWIAKPIMAEYAKRSKCVVKQYDKCELFPGHFVSGEQTLAENLADTGGLKVAYWAYVEEAGGEAVARAASGMLPGYTDEQLFFLAYGQSWCQVISREHALENLANDEHAPPPFRTNVPLSTFAEFHRAFKCPLGSRMRPADADQCKVWW